MGQTINAGGLYSSVLPNCSCIYKFDGFTRKDEKNINLPGSNFYDYSKHTELDNNGNEVELPDWKVINNRLVAQVDNPWISFRSTIPLGMVFYYGGYEDNYKNFKLNLYYNEKKIGLTLNKNEGYYNPRMEGVYGKQIDGTMSANIFSFSHYTKSEDSYRNFAVCNGFYAKGIEPVESGILYILEFQGAQKDKTYLTNLVLQRNTLECVNLNNENTLLFPTNVVYPTGYLSIPVRGACRQNINTVFYNSFPVAAVKGQKNNKPDISELNIGRIGFIKSNNINDNYCEVCYELEKQLLPVAKNKNNKINELDRLILRLDIAWIEKQEELASAQNQTDIDSINSEISYIEYEIKKLKQEKELVKGYIFGPNTPNPTAGNHNQNFEESEIAIPHDRGIYLPTANPCLSEEPKITVDIEGTLTGASYYEMTFDAICVGTAGLTSLSQPEKLKLPDLDISGTYELEANQSGTFSCNFTKKYTTKCTNGSGNDADREVVVYIEVSCNYAFFDIETGKIRHYVRIDMSIDGVGSIDRCYAISFSGNEWLNSVENLCQKETTIEADSFGISLLSNCGYFGIVSNCGDKILTSAYSTRTISCADCELEPPLTLEDTEIYENIGNGVVNPGCKEVKESTKTITIPEFTDMFGNVTPAYETEIKFLEIDEDAECKKIKFTIKAS